MSQELVAYTDHAAAALLPSSRGLMLPGEVQGVFFTVPAAVYEVWLSKVEGWFAEREEVTIVDYGITDKQGLGYIIIEWGECEADPWFLNKLSDDEDVQDYTLYTLEVE